MVTPKNLLLSYCGFVKIEVMPSRGGLAATVIRNISTAVLYARQKQKK